MEIKRFEFNYFGENTYVIWDKTSKEAAIVDPGMVNPDEVSEIESYISGNSLDLKYILLTHIHIDHTFGIDALKSHYGVKVYAHKADEPLGQTRSEQAQRFHLPVELGPVNVDRGDTLFNRSIGRTDLPGGNQRQLILSIRTKLLELPTATVVYPGHGPSTTIGEEEQFNPFL